MTGSVGGWILKNSPIPITKKPALNDPVLRAKLAKGMGHNYYVACPLFRFLKLGMGVSSGGPCSRVVGLTWKWNQA
jgi:hypothetical protein